MNEFINSFNTYIKEASYKSLLFWAFPLGTIVLVWILVITGTKLFRKRKKLKTAFIVNRAWIICSLAVACVITSLLSYWWSKNYFVHHPLQLPLLISLTISMIIPVVCLLNLRSYYSQESLKEITEQPKTSNQLDASTTLVKNAFRRNKLYYLLPFAGLAFLLFYLNKGINLISVIYDNSESMQTTNAISALSETFDNLLENNEITITSIDGYTQSTLPAAKTSLSQIMPVTRSSDLKGGNVMSFGTPAEAQTGLSRIPAECLGSPIGEAIWKTFLYIRETKANMAYKNKLLIVFTDGADNILGESVASGKFFFDDEGFAELFPPDKVFIIDYSNGKANYLKQRFENAGCDVYPSENSKQAYLDALDNALQSFKNDWFLIYWTILILVAFTLVGILIQPKKIV